MKTVFVGNALVTSILKIIHQKCELIGRPGLSKVKAEDIKVLSETATGRIIRLHGMKYQVDLVKETFGIFDPVPSSCVRRRSGARRGHLVAE